VSQEEALEVLKNWQTTARSLSLHTISSDLRLRDVPVNINSATALVLVLGSKQESESIDLSDASFEMLPATGVSRLSLQITLADGKVVVLSETKGS